MIFILLPVTVMSPPSIVRRRKHDMYAAFTLSFQWLKSISPCKGFPYMYVHFLCDKGNIQLTSLCFYGEIQLQTFVEGNERDELGTVDKLINQCPKSDVSLFVHTRLCSMPWCIEKRRRMKGETYNPFHFYLGFRNFCCEKIVRARNSTLLVHSIVTKLSLTIHQWIWKVFVQVHRYTLILKWWV